MATNIGRKFLNLIKNHFPRNNKFHKIFNSNNVKVSYGCMPNVGAAINSHNKTILNEKRPLERGGCNCQRRYRDNCPQNGECLTENVLYEAAVTSDLRNYGEKLYKGITEGPFKNRLNNHEKSFNNKQYAGESSLSKEIWRIKEKKGTYNIRWRIIKQYPSYNPATKRCILCLNEKLEILDNIGPNLLNQRSELIATCRHRHKYKLSTYDVS